MPLRMSLALLRDVLNNLSSQPRKSAPFTLFCHAASWQHCHHLLSQPGDLKQMSHRLLSPRSLHHVLQRRGSVIIIKPLSPRNRSKRAIHCSSLLPLSCRAALSFVEPRRVSEVNKANYSPFKFLHSIAHGFISNIILMSGESSHASSKLQANRKLNSEACECMWQ